MWRQIETSTIALQVMLGDKKGTQYLGNKWATLFLREKNMVVSPLELRPNNDCIGEDQQQL
jgi:hypothetical protein